MTTRTKGQIPIRDFWPTVITRTKAMQTRAAPIIAGFATIRAKNAPRLSPFFGRRVADGIDCLLLPDEALDLAGFAWFCERPCGMGSLLFVSIKQFSVTAP